LKKSQNQKNSSSTVSQNTTPTTSTPSQTSRRLTDGQRRRLEEERNSVQQQYDLVNKKFALLREAHTIETDVATKFKLEVQIRENQTEKDRLAQQLEEIEQKLL